MIENSTHGLTVLDADLDVDVVDPDPAALAAWTPAPGRPARRVAAELAVVVDARGQRWVEVRIDGVRVGGLPADAARRHARHIDAVLDRGGRPAVNGLVRPGPRLELRLPDPASPVRAPLPPAGPPAERPDAIGMFEPLPQERPRSRTPVLVGAGVLALLLAVGAVAGVRSGGEQASSGPAAIRITTSAPVPTTAPTTTAPAPTTEEAEEAEVEAVATPTQVRRSRASSAPAATTAPTTTAPAPVVVPTTTAPPPAPTSAAGPPPAALTPSSSRRAPGRDDDCDEPGAARLDPDCAEAGAGEPGPADQGRPGRG